MLSGIFIVKYLIAQHY